MKKITLTLLLTCIVFTFYAQDIIVKRDGAEIQAKVLEITENTIRYKDYDFQEGPTRNINISQVFMIIYENGRRETFSDHPGSIPEKGSLIEEEPYFSLSFGYGNSYGGFGLRLQYVTAGDVRFGFHGGVGYFPFLRASIFPSGGIKVYIWEDLYANAQFGLFGITSNWDEDTWDYMYGPGILLGYDWFLNKTFGFNTASGISLDIGGSGRFWWAVDAGIVIRF